METTVVEPLFWEERVGNCAAVAISALNNAHNALLTLQSCCMEKVEGVVATKKDLALLCDVQWFLTDVDLISEMLKKLQTNLQEKESEE